MVQASVETKRMSVWNERTAFQNRQDVTLAGDAQCRPCNCKDCEFSLQQLLVDNGCMAEDVTCGYVWWIPLMCFVDSVVYREKRRSCQCL